MKQTAVEWFFEELWKEFNFSCSNNILEKAKEMERKDMQEYATFCIECDRKQMPLLLVEDWYKIYKKA